MRHRLRLERTRRNATNKILPRFVPRRSHTLNCLRQGSDAALNPRPTIFTQLEMPASQETSLPPPGSTVPRFHDGMRIRTLGHGAQLASKITR
jgi:hypothetical protein